jgi:N-acetyl-beta-hexosaminidase
MLSNYETEDLKVYKLYQLKRIVQYATDRGIEVIPELDVPAHSRYINISIVNIES